MMRWIAIEALAAAFTYSWPRSSLAVPHGISRGRRIRHRNCESGEYTGNDAAVAGAGSGFQISGLTAAHNDALSFSSPTFGITSLLSGKTVANPDGDIPKCGPIIPFATARMSSVG